MSFSELGSVVYQGWSGSDPAGAMYGVRIECKTVSADACNLIGGGAEHAWTFLSTWPS